MLGSSFDIGVIPHIDVAVHANRHQGFRSVYEAKCLVFDFFFPISIGI